MDSSVLQWHTSLGALTSQCILPPETKPYKIILNGAIWGNAINATENRGYWKYLRKKSIQPTISDVLLVYISHTTVPTRCQGKSAHQPDRGLYLRPQQATLAPLKITQQSTFYQHSTNKLRFGLNLKVSLPLAYSGIIEQMSNQYKMAYLQNCTLFCIT